MTKPRPGLGASLAIRDAAEQIERQRVQTRRPDTDLPTDDVVAQLLAESGNYAAMLILGSSPRFVQDARERLEIPTPWQGRSKEWMGVAGKIAHRRWAMWQDGPPAPISHEDLEAMIKAELANKRQFNPAGQALTIYGVLIAVRQFKEDHGRWPTRGEVAVALDRDEADITPKLVHLRQKGYIEQSGQTLVPTETAPNPGLVTTSTWSRAEIDAHLAQIAAERAPVDSPFAGMKKAPAARRPAAQTPQEVQQDMKGFRNENRPTDAALVEMVKSRLRQGMTTKAAIVAVAGDLKVPETSAHTWYYAAEKVRKDAEAQAALDAAAQTAAQATADDDLFAPDAPAQPIAPAPAVALAAEQALGGDGSTEQTDPSAGLTDRQEGNVRSITHQTAPSHPIDDGRGDEAQPFATGGLLMSNPLVDATASGYTWAFPGTLPAGVLAHGEMYTIVPKAEHEARQQRIVDLEIEAMQLPDMRNLLTAKQGTIDKLEADASELRTLYEGAVASYHNLQAATANHANVANLMAENEQLQADLKVALHTIEQGGLEASTTYLLMNGDDAMVPVAVEPDQDLDKGDEYPHLNTDSGRRRYDLWHCTDKLRLPGGHIVCILRPGAAETAGQEAA